MNPDNFRRASILIIEDNEDQWLIVRSTLQKNLAEVRPVWVRDAQQTITYLTDCLTDTPLLPKLILLDLYLPEREDGWQLLQQLKEHPVLQRIPVVIFSNSNDRADRTKAYDQGATSFIQKPMDYEQWLTYFKNLRQYWWETVTLPR